MASELYESWFKVADQDGDNKIGGAEAVSFFMKSGLEKKTLAEVSDSCCKMTTPATSYTHTLYVAIACEGPASPQSAFAASLGFWDISFLASGARVWRSDVPFHHSMCTYVLSHTLESLS